MCTRASLVIFLFLSFFGYSQKSQDSFRVLGIKYEDGDPQTTSRTGDSSVIVVCVVELLDTLSINKLHIRVTDPKKNSIDVFRTAYELKKNQDAKQKNEVAMKREGNLVYLPVYKTTVSTEYVLEISAEDTEGRISPAAKLNK